MSARRILASDPRQRAAVALVTDGSVLAKTNAAAEGTSWPLEDDSGQASPNVFGLLFNVHLGALHAQTQT